MDVKQELLGELNKVGLSGIVKDVEGIEEVLALRGKDLTNLTDQKISKLLYTITQYQIYLQLYHNIKNIEYLRVKRKYDIALSRALTNQKGKTIKEKTAQALTDVGLADLETEFLKAEAQYLLFVKIPESFLELANALKKEMSLRSKKYEYK